MDELTFPALTRRTLAASALGVGEPTTHALTSPIHLATTYIRCEDGNYSTGRAAGPYRGLVQIAEADLAGISATLDGRGQGTTVGSQP